MEYKGKIFKPVLGYALVREIDLARTEAGIVLPNVTKELLADGKVTRTTSGHHELIEASEGHYVDGNLVRCDLQPGDQVTLSPGAGRASMPHYPPKVYVVTLRDIIAYERKAQTAH